MFKKKLAIQPPSLHCLIDILENHTPGFQNNSANITILAAVRVIPVEAAVMDKTATRNLSSNWN